MNFGQHVRELRKEKGLTLRKAAKRAEISHPYLSQLETGKNNKPAPEIIKKIAKGLGVSYTQLLEKAGYLPEGTLDNNLKTAQWASENQEKLKQITESFTPTPPDLQQLLNKKYLTFNGWELKPDDQQKILDMIAVMFPQYTKEKEKS